MPRGGTTSGGPKTDLSTAKLDAVTKPHITLPSIPDKTTAAPRPRRASTARPVKAFDRALVERSTELLHALEVVEQPENAVRDVAVRQTPVRDLAVMPEAPETREVTLITAKSKAVHVTAAPARAPRRIAPRHWRVSALMWVVSFVFVAGGIFAAAATLGQHLAPKPFTPHAASIDTLPSNSQLADAWATGVGVSKLDIGGGAGPGATAPGSAGLPVKPPTGPTATPAQSAPPASASGIQAAPVKPWPPANAYMFVPGHPAFAVNGSGGFYSWTFGQCTWWAQNKRRDENLMHMGNAQYWANGAAGRGYKVGSVPVANATVVFQPGVQGAGGAGHVAHVEAVYPNGWFLVSEMNFYWNGGGNARVDYRYAHSGSGVSFIY